MAAGRAVLPLFLAATLLAAVLPLVSAVLYTDAGASRRQLRQAAAPCTDVPTPEGFTCQQQKAWGKCSAPWMIAGQFCRLTCNLCGGPAGPQGVAPPPADVVQSLQEGAPGPEARTPPAGCLQLAPPTTTPPQPDQLPAGLQAPALGAAFCRQPADKGPCRAAVPAWFFDAAAATCKPFLYGGCQGNANRFAGFDECQAAAQRHCAP